MSESLWHRCVHHLEQELPENLLNMWIRKLRPIPSERQDVLFLEAPNRFVKDWVEERYLDRIQEISCQETHQSMMRVEIVNSSGSVSQQRYQRTPAPSSDFPRAVAEPSSTQAAAVIDVARTPQQNHVSSVSSASLRPSSSESSTHYSSTNGYVADGQDFEAADVGDRLAKALAEEVSADPVAKPVVIESSVSNAAVEGGIMHRSNINADLTFESFVQGKSNQLGLAAARQVSENPGHGYNPLFIYGGVGLGKTHLMHAVGNSLLQKNRNLNVVYLHSERFVADMIKALRLGAINEFKRYYRSVDALLIDDIQFFAGKERSQEEFFHTFNALLEGHQQIILTCDSYHREISDMDDRLKSRLGWGLTVAIEPPELETRVAILLQKAQQMSVELPHDAAFFIADRVRSNVRELEGALKRVVANSQFRGQPICVDLVREALRDLLALQDKQVTIDNIQRTVAEYYQIRLGDLLSKRRSRSVARPRQLAMTLAKELTSHSYPEIGDAFGGRDHTTVLHATRKIRELMDTQVDIQQDWQKLYRSLTT